MGEPRRITADEAAELGRLGGIKSGEVRRAKRDEKAETRAEVLALERFAAKSDDIAAELLDAAFGTGKWAHADAGGPVLDPKERAALLKTCLEYAVGRPRPMAVPAESPPESDQKKGIAFGVRAPAVPLPESALEAELALQKETHSALDRETDEVHVREAPGDSQAGGAREGVPHATPEATGSPQEAAAVAVTQDLMYEGDMGLG